MAERFGTTDSDRMARTILEQLACAGDFKHGYSLLMALQHIAFGRSSIPATLPEFADRIREGMRTLYAAGMLVPTLVARLQRLVVYVSTSQMTLHRDTSTQSLLRKSSSGLLGGSYEVSQISGEMRICLNLLHLCVILHQHESTFVESLESTKLHLTLLSALKLHADSTMPVRKVILLLFKLLQLHASDSDIYLPSNSTSLDAAPATPDATSGSPMVTLVNSIPFLSVPALSDFRSFVALGLHQHSLINWTPPSGGPMPRPAAIDEAIDLIDGYLTRFMETYRFHAAELDFMKHSEFLTNVLALHAKLVVSGQIPKCTRSNLLRVPRSSRFSIAEVARNMIANYHLVRGSREPEVESSADESSAGEGSPKGSSSLPYLPLVHEAYQSCHSWMTDESNQDEVIEAIAEAAVVPPPTLEGPQDTMGEEDVECGTLLDKIYPFPHLREAIVTLLKILLSSCRGSIDPLASPTNHPSFDLDRDHLLTLLDSKPVLVSKEAGIRRNFEIISSAISGILLLLLKLHKSQSSAIQQTIVANNGCLVLLKIITSYPADEGTVGSHMDSVFPFLKDNASWNLAVPARLPTTLFRSLKALYVVCKHSPSRIKKFLVHYKLAVVLKRFFALPNVAILKVAYQLFKIQIRYLNRKWRLMHIKLISCCYHATSLDPVDDWLVHDPDLQTNDNSMTATGEDVLNDSVCSETGDGQIFDPEEYARALSLINFEREDEVAAFCAKFKCDRSEFFGKGITNYRHWLEIGIGY